ncbi:MAG TPA: recombination factor protein RarA, partial [Casimicrobiaceae bacterium]|nr:recombination factor protein RarA [Casimicrobiaceae bacterium]
MADLLTQESLTAVPLAERMRPRTIEEFVGQHHLLDPGRVVHDMLHGGHVESLILWGPPGSGKTT